jgi:phosphoribosylformylglycinamidine cyclo-ligase
LDYYATGKLDGEVAARVVASIAQGCRQAGCALIGGETAEMPGMYAAGDYDLAGFCVGAVERDKVLTGSTIEPGDVILGLESSGLHSNGFSLVRRIVRDRAWDLKQRYPGDQGRSLGEVLLEPTRIYVRSLLPLVQERQIKGLAHITGGGLIENIPRVLPVGTRAIVETGSWEPSTIFTYLKEGGNLAPQEMVRTFNCGVGMVVIVGHDRAEDSTAALIRAGEKVFTIGRIVEGRRGCTLNGPARGWGSSEQWTATHNV